jgi:hypothetical protein
MHAGGGVRICRYSESTSKPPLREGPHELFQWQALGGWVSRGDLHPNQAWRAWRKRPDERVLESTIRALRLRFGGACVC